MHILLMDNEPESQRLVASILTSCGHHVQTAATIESAFALNEAVDLVIADAATPGVYDLTLTASLRQTWPCAKMLLICDADVANRLSRLPNGDCAFLSSPVCKKTLFHALRKLTHARNESRRRLVVHSPDLRWLRRRGDKAHQDCCAAAAAFAAQFRRFCVEFQRSGPLFDDVCAAAGRLPDAVPYS